MKATKTTTTAYEVKNENGSALIVGVSCGDYFVKTSDGFTRYTTGEMMEIFNLDSISLQNIKEVLNK